MTADPSLVLADWLAARLRQSALFGAEVHIDEPPAEQDPPVPAVEYRLGDADWEEPLPGEDWSNVRVLTPVLTLRVGAAPDTLRSNLLAAERELWRLLLSRDLAPERPVGMLSLSPGATAYGERDGNYAEATVTVFARFHDDPTET